VTTISALLSNDNCCETRGLERRDLEVLLGHCLNVPRSFLYTHPQLQPEPEQQTLFRNLCRQRQRGIPTAYLTGQQYFWDLQLQVTAPVLIPRPETELLVETALELGGRHHHKVLELGSGSGAISLVLARNRPRWRILGVEWQREALRLARRNQRMCGARNLCWRRSHWYQALAGQRFDMIISNPPYVSSLDPRLRQELRFEARTALAAEAGGLDCLRHIISGARKRLRPGGRLILEHGHRQGAAVRRLLSVNGLISVTSRRDLAGHERISIGWRHR